MTIFLFYEWKMVENPLIPFNAFKNRSCIITFLCTTLHGLVVWCLIYYLPLYYEVVQGLNPMQSGLAMLPETLTIVPASILTGLLITWSGRYRWAIWAGWAVTVTGVGLLHLLHVGTPRRMWIGLNLVAGCGTGMLFGAMGFAVQASVSSKNMAVAVAMFTFFRSLGAVRPFRAEVQRSKLTASTGCRNCSRCRDIPGSNSAAASQNSRLGADWSRFC